MRWLTDGKRHLICVPYSVPGLHIMANALEINHCWFHNGKFPHYDIPKKRLDEIKAKCHVVSTREIVRIIKESQMSAFEKFFEAMSPRFPSDTSRYFAKPLLKEAFQAGEAKAKADKRSKKVQPVAGTFEVIAAGRSGAADANE